MFNLYELGEACHGEHLIHVRAHIRHLECPLACHYYAHRLLHDTQSAGGYKCQVGAIQFHIGSGLADGMLDVGLKL